MQIGFILINKTNNGIKYKHYTKTERVRAVTSFHFSEGWFCWENKKQKVSKECNRDNPVCGKHLAASY